LRRLSIPFIGIFALHLEKNNRQNISLASPFQFPLLGFLLCIKCVEHGRGLQSGPFNSLYWDFCFASKTKKLRINREKATFNSLYWDFCFASFWLCDCFGWLVWCFQFPLLGFLLCIIWLSQSHETAR